MDYARKWIIDSSSTTKILLFFCLFNFRQLSNFTTFFLLAIRLHLVYGQWKCEAKCCSFLFPIIHHIIIILSPYSIAMSFYNTL